MFPLRRQQPGTQSGTGQKRTSRNRHYHFSVIFVTEVTEMHDREQGIIKKNPFWYFYGFSVHFRGKKYFIL